MRRATASTWLLGLMVGFILIFVAYILMSINYSRTIRIKNDMISMIERYEGLNSTSLALVNNYLGSINHRVTGDCGSGSGFYGAPDLNSATLEPAQGGKKYFYCIKKFKGAGTSNYYQVTVFYRFNLPVVGAAGIFTVRGVTGNFQPFDDSAYAQATDGSYTSGIHSPSPGGGGGGTTPPTTPTYAVTFNLNGGIGMVSTQYIKSGNKASMPSNTPVRDGFTFNGWKLNGSAYDFNSAVTGNITLMADWQKVTSGEEFTVPSGYVLAGACNKSSISSIKDFIINCGKHYGYYTSKSLVISGFPVTDGEKTSLPNIKAFACNDYNSFASLGYTSAQLNECTSSIDSLYNSLPQKVIYK